MCSKAAQFIKQKLPDLLRSYIDADVSGNQEGGFQDIAIEVLHLLLSHLLFGQKGAFGVGQEQIDAFLKTLRRGKCGVFLEPDSLQILRWAFVTYSQCRLLKGGGEAKLTKSSQQNWKKNTAVLAYCSFGEQ